MINCTGVFDGRPHVADRPDNGKCESHNPEYVGRLRLPDKTLYCQRKREHDGLCRSNTHEWLMGGALAIRRNR